MRTAMIALAFAATVFAQETITERISKLEHANAVLLQRQEPTPLEKLTFLQDLVPYEHAKRAQISFRRRIGYIGSVSRSSMDGWTRFPGGLEKVSGWTSKLYRSKNTLDVETYLIRQDEADNLSTQTWWKTFPRGSVFADELRNSEGVVFEVRVAEKGPDGKWERYVAYRDRMAYPKGYVSIKSRDCRSCHDLAGTSVYGGAAVPGADSVISDPIAKVESGSIFQP